MALTVVGAAVLVRVDTRHAARFLGRCAVVAFQAGRRALLEDGEGQLVHHGAERLVTGGKDADVFPALADLDG